ncbi:hypothetical protein WUBG_00247 [Wuchereria bancrofti]|uniref:Uncharacterized protein n=2 Tax=Wuchereria bancrofti TaxID=6293 RepID=J9BMP5_WUCBA|nr:hypothetical protein WUBG_00247 [Wuchereria bancrofti]
MDSPHRTIRPNRRTAWDEWLDVYLVRCRVSLSISYLLPLAFHVGRTAGYSLKLLSFSTSVICPHCPVEFQSLFSDTMAGSTMEAGPSSPEISPTVDQYHSSSLQRKKRRLHADQRAQLTYQKIAAERKAEKEKRQLEREKRQKVLEEYTSIKQKMNKALLKKNRRGQPNLNAQIEVLLEKIEKRMEKS